MPTIKISRAQNGSAAIDYALGKNRLKDSDKEYLVKHGMDKKVVDNLHNRAVVQQSYNLIDINHAKAEMKQTRAIANNRGKTQCMRFIQSFADYEIDVNNPNDWQKANDIGVEIAKKIAPNNEFSIYTHIDGEGHKVHNHIIMNMVNLETGKKYHHTNDFNRVAKFNDDLAEKFFPMNRNMHMQNQIERKTMAERKLKAKNQYIWKDDLRHRIDSVMLNENCTSKLQFEHALKEKGVIYRERGKNCSYSFLDANNKQHTSRGNKLGHDYEKETIHDELVGQANKLRQRKQRADRQDYVRNFSRQPEANTRKTTIYTRRARQGHNFAEYHYQTTSRRQGFLETNNRTTKQYDEKSRQSYQAARTEQPNLSANKSTFNKLFERIRRNLRAAIKYEVQCIKTLTKQALSKLDSFLDDRLSDQGAINIQNNITDNHLDMNQSIKDLKKQRDVFKRTDRKYQISKKRKIIDPESPSFKRLHRRQNMRGPHL
ncbi:MULTISPECIES: relaxase/mobilization nuclease domain-containing protein [Apilactobacillus]|uniref:Mobilization protein n=1 Tax=Apilactobacillus micheneri TaxID=1899430 RepID=A0A9Q8MTL5_9LACO|nr:MULTISPECIES: relaxase/mobilization nuclease domain-containing protein [Apilactobacillus]TPR15878.1 mobilization protein [Apilactobacillus timberlakei]TPR37592.1 mobilization protein [Apilactobacillus micheneri]TPR38723.1 mobilization protein [Apilactobacillus micheneri]TPR42327.1 mobilization protein [Apilactobacillus micheneri]TPR42391.1 mobilization protein [Apilactobacillus micheneri]